ncbi:MAG: actin, cytoplasmic 2 [Candidatus Hodarchaeota archaeon]
MNAPLIIDNGSDTTKCGYAGDNHPRSIFPTLVGYGRGRSIMGDVNLPPDYVPEYYIGEEAMSLRGILRFDFPVESGLVTEWRSMEKIWFYIFYNDLRVNPVDHPVLLTEPPLNPALNRERMAEFFFETLNVPAMAVLSSASLALQFLEKTTGLIVDMGGDATHIVPIYDNSVISHAISRIGIAGQDITKYLLRLLRQRGYILNSGAERRMVREAKERFCYVALDPEEQMRFIERTIESESLFYLPDGGIAFGVGSIEKFCAPEILFNPAALGLSEYPLHEGIYRSIQNCEPNIQPELYQNIILTGGSSLFFGLKERLHKELTKLVPETTKIQIFAPPQRELAAWLGGSMLASQPFFSKFWVWREDYQKYGSVIARPGVLSKFHPLGQNLKPHLVRLRQQESCPFCGILGILVGQEKETGKRILFCLTCKNKIL